MEKASSAVLESESSPAMLQIDPKALCSSQEKTFLLWLAEREGEDYASMIAAGGTTFDPVPSTSSDLLSFSCKTESRKDKRLAVKIVPARQAVVVWDLEKRRRTESSLDFHINKGLLCGIATRPDSFGCVYSHFYEGGASGDYTLDKVMVVGFSAAEEFFRHALEYLAPNPYDLEVADQASRKRNHMLEAIAEESGSGGDVGRKRYSTSYYARRSSFRERVLDAYGNRCAVCRIDEPCALEAAHRRGYEVATGDFFEERHGVCLCANHHRMYDTRLFSIDFGSLELVDVDERVLGQEWYRVFLERYEGKVLAPV